MIDSTSYEEYERELEAYGPKYYDRRKRIMLPEEYNEPIDVVRHFGAEISEIANMYGIDLDGVLLMQELLGTEGYRLPRPDYRERLEDLMEGMNAVLEQKIYEKRQDNLEYLIHEKIRKAA